MMPPDTATAAEQEPRIAAEERRAAPRYHVTLTADCRPVDNIGRCCQGEVRDISTLGVGFVLPRPVEQSDLLEIELRKKTTDFVKTLLARVVHVEPDDAGAWLVGCAFTRELTDAELRQFQAQRVRPEGPDSRRWVRFPCNVETVCYTSETVPGERRPARIVNISPGGLGLLLPCQFTDGTLLRFQTPAHLEQPGREMLVRVVRVLEQTRGYWFLGCEFAGQLRDEDLWAFLL
jgi:hypothetical protein